MTALIRECQENLAHGAQITLIVDPSDEAVLAFRPGQPVRILQDDDRIDVDEVLPGVTMRVRELFGAIMLPWALRQAHPREHGSMTVEGEAGQTEDGAAPTPPNG